MTKNIDPTVASFLHESQKINYATTHTYVSGRTMRRHATRKRRIEAKKQAMEGRTHD